MANIFAEFAQPVRSISDYQNDYDKQALVRGQLLGQTRTNELAGLMADQQRMTIADTSRRQNALRQAAAAGKGMAPDAYASSLLANPDTMDAGVALQKHLADTGKVQADTSKTKGETATGAFKLRTDAADTAIKDIAALSSPEHAVASLQAHFQAGDIDAVKYQSVLSTIPNDPSKFPAWQIGMLQRIMSAKDQMSFAKPDANAQLQSETSIQTTGMNNATSVKTTGMNNATSVQTTGMTNATNRANNSATIGKDFAVAGLNPDGSMRGMATDGSGKVDLSKVAPEDMAAAYRYKSDGTLPPNMGRGQQGAAESKRLRAIASALDDQAGESPEDARIRQLALKGDVTAINQMRRREVNVGANVKNFDFNADQVLELSKKVDRSGVPILNAWINAGRRSVTGNPELSAFDVAVKTTVNEFAQIVSGTTAGATTEGEKKKAEQLLNAQQTPEQIVSVINQMQIESKNRMRSFADQRKQSMPTNRAGGAPAAPAGEPPPAKTGSGATVSKW